MKYILTNTGLTVVDNNEKSHHVETSHPNFSKICVAVSNNNQEDFDSLLNQRIVTFDEVEFSHPLFQQKDGVWFYRDTWVLGEPFINKLKSMVSLGFSLDPLILFLDNLYNNVSNRVIEQLIQFMDYKELPITEDGCFIAYKGLQADKYSVHGNPNVQLLQGVVNERGQVLNEQGHVIEVRRNQVNDDPNVHCSHGLHAGSYEYAKDFSQGILATVKINPIDVVAVPTDYSCQKLRCCKYVVIKHEVSEIPIPVSDGVEGSEVEKSDIEKIEKTLAGKSWDCEHDYYDFAQDCGVGEMVVKKYFLERDGLKILVEGKQLYIEAFSSDFIINPEDEEEDFYSKNFFTDSDDEDEDY
jgi:hypothetical protein